MNPELLQMQRSELEWLGYRVDKPKRSIAAYIDEQVCAEETCTNCGRDGLTYEPWITDDSYVALMVCPDCGCGWEF